MGSICILTDSAAQFPQLGFPGRDMVRVISYSVEINGRLYLEGRDLRPHDLPAAANDTLHPKLIPPSIEQFESLFSNLSQHYDDILVILTSTHLNQAFQNAQIAAQRAAGRARIALIDSQTTAVGLALLVQKAAEAAANGFSAEDIESQIRSAIPHTYLMICPTTLSYMQYTGLVDPAQALVSDMLNLLPIFTLEEGLISAVEKVRNMRGLVDYMQEFISEFDDIAHIALIQSIPPAPHEARMMREYTQNSFDQVPFSENTINLPLATLLGPHTIGLVVMENHTSLRR